jgi:DNA-binding NarL/FixJ family response regulator
LRTDYPCQVGRLPTDRDTVITRELDALSDVALGCTNAEVALRFSLQPETVKRTTTQA